MGLAIITDVEDADLLDRAKWYAWGGGYANHPRVGYLHLLIAERVFGSIPEGVLVDHRNGDRLDNRRSNLRLVDRSQHAANRVSTNATGFRWVHAQPRGGFAAEVRWHGKRHRKYGFRTAAEAHAWAKGVADQVQGGDAFHRVRGEMSSD
jgi:hypothetical protein